MAHDLLPISAQLPADLAAEIEGARDTLAAAKAASTQKAYASDWRRFCDFCEARNVEALPAHPDIVALFIHVEAEAGIAPVTIGRRIAAITHHHRDAGLTSPSARDGAGVIAAMLAGVRRKYARKKEQKSPVQADVLKAMLASIEGMGVRARRDRAILALGMAGAFRRSELAALRLEDLKFTNTGLRITIPKSKRDQEGAGQTIAISRRALHPAGHVAAPLAACGRARPARPPDRHSAHEPRVPAADPVGRAHHRRHHRQDDRAPGQDGGGGGRPRPPPSTPRTRYAPASSPRPRPGARTCSR